jgi:poly(3-hydroxybutyrate) depolymerase
MQSFSERTSGTERLTPRELINAKMEGFPIASLRRQIIMKTTLTPLLLVTLLCICAYTSRGQATLQFGATSYTVAESAGAVTLTVQRTGDTTTAVTVDYATVDGTATNGIKYSSVSGTLRYDAGDTNQVIMVPILDNGIVDGTKSFHVLLSNPTGGATLGTTTNATVAITDNDFGIQFQFASNSVTEDAGQALIRVVRDDDGNLPVSVTVYTTDSNAHSGTDYLGITNLLTFAPQERLQLISIPILNNTLKQLNRKFLLTLANPTNTSLGSQRNSTVTIVDNDLGFQFQSPTNSVSEDAGVVFVNVLRGTDATNTAVTVDCATSDATAINGLDYIGQTNTLAFAPGEMIKQVALRILDNGIKQLTRTFRLNLSNPTGGAVLGVPATSTVLIFDNDPGVGFNQTRYTNAWGNGGRITVTILRGNDLALGPFTVDYATADSTAVAGQDYQASSGTLQFQANETVKTITIPLLKNRAVEGSKYFQLKLSNPTGGSTLATATATLYIVGSYVPVAPQFDTALTIEPDGLWNTLSWAGGGLLQRADNPSGPWQTLTTAHSPTTIASTIPTSFYRVTRPRPVNLYVPSGYDGNAPVPLVILLHGYSWTGSQQENWMHFQPLAETQGFLYCYPDSTVDPSGNQFWSATDACCDQWDANIDDVGFLRRLIQEISRQFAVDPKRVYLIGHSNGGYLSYHMACENSDLIAAIAAVSGSTFLDTNSCTPSEPVNILQIHGTADQWQFYAGGANVIADGWTANLPPFPSAPQSVQTWAGYNGASDPVSDPLPSMDLTTDVAGLETVVTRYTNSPPGGAVELWTINGATHWPNLTPQFAPAVINWLFAHPKP